MTSFTAQDIAAAVQGQLQGNQALRIDGAAGLEDATPAQISFFHNMKYLDSLQSSKALAIIIPDNTNGAKLPEGKTWIRVTNPQWAFAQALTLLYPDRNVHPRGIHPKAVIDPTAEIASDVYVGPLSVIEAGASVSSGTTLYSGVYVGANVRIGPDSVIYSNVTLYGETHIGARVIIHAGAVLGSDGYGFALKDGKHHKIPQVGRVVVEDDVEIGANVTVDRATTGETRIGAGTKIDNLVHIAHNVQIGRDSLIVAQVGISGSTRVGDHVTLAGQVGVTGHLTIGDGAVIAAQSGIMSNVAPGEVLFGSPARPHREAMKLEALFGKLPEMYALLKQLKKKVLS